MAKEKTSRSRKKAAARSGDPEPGERVRVVDGPYDGLTARFDRRMGTTGYLRVMVEPMAGPPFHALVTKIEKLE